jgi:hypothetical protein
MRRGRDALKWSGCREDRGERISKAISAVDGFIADYPGRVREDQITIAREALKQYHATDAEWNRAGATLFLSASPELEESVATFHDDATEVASLIDSVNLPPDQTRAGIRSKIAGQLSDAMVAVEATTDATPTEWSSRSATAVKGGT